MTKKINEGVLIDNDIINAPEVTEKQAEAVKKPLDKPLKKEAKNKSGSDDLKTKDLEPDKTAQIIAGSVADLSERTGLSMSQSSRDALSELSNELSKMVIIPKWFKLPALTIAFLLPLSPSIFKFYKSFKEPQKKGEDHGLNA